MTEQTTRILVNYLVVGAAGCFGAMARYAVGSVCNRWFGGAFPIGTFVINITGSFFLGWFATLMKSRAPSTINEMTYLALAVGFTGAYTTFSTWMFESNGLLLNGSELKALVNLIGSLVVGLLALKLGVAMGRV